MVSGWPFLSLHVMSFHLNYSRRRVQHLAPGDLGSDSDSISYKLGILEQCTNVFELRFTYLSNGDNNIMILTFKVILWQSNGLTSTLALLKIKHYTRVDSFFFLFILYLLLGLYLCYMKVTTGIKAKICIKFMPLNQRLYSIDHSLYVQWLPWPNHLIF